LIGSSSSKSKSKVKNLLTKSTFDYVKNHIKNIKVQSNIEDYGEEFKNKSNKASEPKVSKQSKF
jgi:uncharacterized membrane protein YgaE (UPF0421/DUF939 family)